MIGESARVVKVMFLRVFLPDQPERTAGILLLEEATGNLFLKIRDDWDRIADEPDAQVLAGVAEDFHKRLDEFGAGGGAAFLRLLEDQLSNVLRLSERQEMTTSNIRSTLDLLFDENCRN